MAGGKTIDWLTNNADVLRHLADSLMPVQRLVTGTAYLIGIAFAFKAIYTLKSYGESRTMMSSSTNIKEPLLYLLVASIFIYFPTGFSILMQTSFGYSSVIAYTSINSDNSTINTIFGAGSSIGRPMTIIIRTIGVIAFVRGWVLIAKSASQGQPPGGTGKGLMHVFGGILAMNIVGTLQIINNTLYGPS